MLHEGKEYKPPTGTIRGTQRMIEHKTMLYIWSGGLKIQFHYFVIINVTRMKDHPKIYRFTQQCSASMVSLGTAVNNNKGRRS